MPYKSTEPTHTSTALSQFSTSDHPSKEWHSSLTIIDARLTLLCWQVWIQLLVFGVPSTLLSWLSTKCFTTKDKKITEEKENTFKCINCQYFHTNLLPETQNEASFPVSCICSTPVTSYILIFPGLALPFVLFLIRSVLSITVPEWRLSGCSFPRQVLKLIANPQLFSPRSL